MKKRSGILLGGFLLLLVILLGVLFVLKAAPDSGNIPYVSTSSNPDGILALKLWLQSLGYTVDEERVAAFHVPAGVSTVFMVGPFSLDTAEVDALREYVNSGGTLIAAGSSYSIGDLADAYSFTMDWVDPSIAQAWAAAPLFVSPPLEGPVPVEAYDYFTGGRSGSLPLLEADAGPVVVTFKSGSGRVILMSSPYPLTNAGLKVSGNPALVLNLLALVPNNGRVWFDEWHHGLRLGQSAPGLESWLRHTPAGYAVLFMVAVVFVALLLQGRSFGQALKPGGPLKRRGSLDYLTAIANLNRRAGHRSAVLEHYRQQLKRHLGQRYRLDLLVSDDEFVDRLSRYNPALDAPALRQLLRNLKKPVLPEAEMVKLVAEASRWMED